MFGLKLAALLLLLLLVEVVAAVAIVTASAAAHIVEQQYGLDATTASRGEEEARVTPRPGIDGPTEGGETEFQHTPIGP